MRTARTFFLIAALFVAMAASAHAPKKVDLDYQSRDGVLKVSIVHPVKDVKDHYIIDIVVSVNGEEVKTIHLSEQTSKEKEETSLNLTGLKAGDEIIVLANCNKFGSKTGTTRVK